MSYSLKQSEFVSEKQGSQYNYFSDEEWNSYLFAKQEDSKWFHDAKYGLFLHVEISAIGMVDISWSRKTHKLPDPPSGFKSVPDEKYDSWAKKLAFPKFNAKEWASIAKENGFKYVVIITKHHDGFHMWDTAYSDHKITNSPFGRDYLKELIDAFREAGLKIGVYYSKRDWTHPPIMSLCLSVNVGKVSVQSTACEQRCVCISAVFFQMTQMPLSPQTDRRIFFFGRSIWD